MDRALGEVPEAYRTAVVLRDVEDLSYEEIAEVLGVSLGTVKSRVGRGREALRRRLSKALPRPAVAVRKRATVMAGAGTAGSDVVMS